MDSLRLEIRLQAYRLARIPSFNHGLSYGRTPAPPEGAGEIVVDRGDGGVAVGGEGGGGALHRHREMKSEKYEREGGYIVG
jgi:hypothetical protein